MVKEILTIPPVIQEELDRRGGLNGLISRLPDDQELQNLVEVHHALSDLIRMKILHLLTSQPLCVCVIREIIGISDSNLSYHLNVLKKAGIIVGEQQGSWIIYSLTERGKKYSIVAQDSDKVVHESRLMCYNEPRKNKK
ncbi:MAG: metalloregulator ArsR/SmtB family transcription factor [Methanomicrobiales archaeon]